MIQIAHQHLRSKTTGSDQAIKAAFVVQRSTVSPIVRTGTETASVITAVIVIIPNRLTSIHSLVHNEHYKTFCHQKVL